MAAAPTTERTPLTWRERRHLDTITEIKALAVAQLDAGEPISLRGIAREMGATAPALYRYVTDIETLGLWIAREVLLDVLIDLGEALTNVDKGVATAVAVWGVIEDLASESPRRFQLVMEHPETRAGLLAEMTTAIDALLVLEGQEPS